MWTYVLTNESVSQFFGSPNLEYNTRQELTDALRDDFDVVNYIPRAGTTRSGRLYKCSKQTVMGVVYVYAFRTN